MVMRSKAYLMTQTDAALMTDRNRPLDDIVNRVDLSPGDKITELLRFGVDALGLNLGIVSHIQKDVYTVKYFYPHDAGLQMEQVFDTRQTYCSITINFAVDRPLAIPHMAASAYRTHPCYEVFQLETYIGIGFKVNGQRYGTVNFSSNEPHTAYSDADNALMLAIAQRIATLMEHVA